MSPFFFLVLLHLGRSRRREKKKHRTPSWLRAPAANIKEAAPPLTSTRALHHDLQLKSVAK